MKRIFLACAFLLTILANARAESTLSMLSLTPGTTGVNWTMPDKSTELAIESQDGVNWTDITVFQGTGLNWSNSFRILPGAVFKMSNIWSKGNQLAIKTQGNTQIIDITYSQSN